MSDQKTTGKRKLSPLEIVAGLVVGIAVIAYMASGSSSGSKTHRAPKNATNSTPVAIAPEMIVTAEKGAFTCKSKDQLSIADHHVFNGEKTLFADMFNLGDPEGFCAEIPPSTQTYRVLKVASSTDDNIVPDMALIVRTGDGGDLQDSFWAGAGALRITKDKK